MSTLLDAPTEETRPLPELTRPLPAEPVAPTRHREPRHRSTWTARFGAFVLVMLALLGTVTLGGRFVDLPSLGFLHNPFASKTVDRSTPPLLESIQDLNRFEAAEGTFQVVIDLEKDRKYVPSFLMGERTLYVAQGQVQAYVDFGAIGAGAVATTKDGAVTITLPEPTLGKASLDLDASHVYEQDRGLVDRLQDAVNSTNDSQHELDALAVKRIDQAAAKTELVDRAEANTRAMLTGLLRSLGHDDVTVTFTK